MSLNFLSEDPEKTTGIPPELDTFQYQTEQFADIKILRYQIPGFESLSLNQKKLLYYLTQAGLAGRDIIYDQNCKCNLLIRKTLENILEHYKGDRRSLNFQKFMVYTKRFWFSNGIHHHYASEKILPEFSREFFKELVQKSCPENLPVLPGEDTDQFLKRLSPLMFDPKIFSKKVNLDSSIDMVLNSAVNFYEGITQKEAEDFYRSKKDAHARKPVSHGLNSRLVKENGKLAEKIFKIDGLYGNAIKTIVEWLEKAADTAENNAQKAVIEKLMEYYKTGDLKTWDEYNILWVKDLDSHVDFVNGFIETYQDPLGRKATWESVVNFKNTEATRRTEIISANAQWFEDHAPILPCFRKKKVKGVSAKVITAVQLGGDNSPSTAIGINLPNADWIRKDYGSKSVTLENITYAYDQASLGNGMLEEFSYDQNEIELVKKYGFLTDNLHTDMHECLGHGSGQLMPGTRSDALQNYQSALEEARADLFALYFLMDEKMVELGLIPETRAAHAEYIKYIRNGLFTQMVRLQPGKDIEEAHMRNRQLIARWCFEMGAAAQVIEQKVKDEKTYFVINDFVKLRVLFGKLLGEIQRIKSEGDFEAGKALIETYGVKVDKKLHSEVLLRYKRLNLAPFSGFINPELIPVLKEGEIKDVRVEYPKDFETQMMKYGREYSFLPVNN